MAIIKDSKSKITLYELIQITRERYYRLKKKRHNSKFSMLKTVLIALAILNRPAHPSDIARFIEENKKRSIYSHTFTVWVDVHDQVKYYLGQLIKKEIGIAEKMNDGYYQLAYTVIPPPLEKSIDFYRKHDTIDQVIVVHLLETMKNCIDDLENLFREGQY